MPFARRSRLGEGGKALEQFFLAGVLLGDRPWRGRSGKGAATAQAAALLIAVDAG